MTTDRRKNNRGPVWTKERRLKASESRRRRHVEDVREQLARIRALATSVEQLIAYGEMLGAGNIHGTPVEALETLRERRKTILTMLKEREAHYEEIKHYAA